MNQLPNTQIIDRLVDAQDRLETAAKSTIQAAFDLGDILIELKAVTPHGKFEEVLKTKARFRFSIQHARTFMRIAENKAQIIEHSGGEPLSIREMERLAKPKQKALPAPSTDGDDEIIDRLMMEPSHTLGRDDVVIDAEFSRVAPQTAETPTQASDEPEIEDAEDYYDIEPDDWEPELDEDQAEVGVPEDVQAELKRLRDDNAWMKSIFEDDNHTSAAIHEIEKLKTINDALQGRVDSLLAENAQMLGRLNYLEARCKKLEKAHAK
ncbi:hypothetical protein CWO84_02830 [Methylomonas sp. Kb3]|uniref:hypothetical protein n=1 Tax=Methylomonas sp. Kb3 TaxID=1611544 RepID=UPI000C33F732|nr:hypothetical protein [Methylomonas sp. Kb3]PKD41976.1 hypothetical protein CWO84_02830 [Methylomonas sp. Kb3]